MEGFVTVSRVVVAEHSVHCLECSFSYKDKDNPDNITQALREHIFETGHKVFVNKTISTFYELSKEI